MDKKESAAAANALIQWFNSQEINSADAELIMLRVQAKLIVDRVPRLFDGPNAIEAAERKFKDDLDKHTKLLMHELIDRIFHKRGTAR